MMTATAPPSAARGGRPSHPGYDLIAAAARVGAGRPMHVWTLTPDCDPLESMRLRKGLTRRGLVVSIARTGQVYAAAPQDAPLAVAA